MTLSALLFRPMGGQKLPLAYHVVLEGNQRQTKETRARYADTRVSVSVMLFSRFPCAVLKVLLPPRGYLKGPAAI